MDEISFLVVNSKKLHSQFLIGHLHQRVSFPVYQARYENDIWSQLDGAKDDIIVYDRCGKLVDHIRMPYSFLENDNVERAIVSAYYENPCGRCEVVEPQVSEDLVTYEVNTSYEGSGDIIDGDPLVYLIELEHEVEDLEKQALERQRVRNHSQTNSSDESQMVGQDEKNSESMESREDKSGSASSEESKKYGSTESKSGSFSSEESKQDGSRQSGSSEESKQDGSRQSGSSEESKQDGSRQFGSSEESKQDGSRQSGSSEEKKKDDDWWKVEKWSSEDKHSKEESHDKKSKDKDSLEATRKDWSSESDEDSFEMKRKDDRPTETNEDNGQDADWWKVKGWSEEMSTKKDQLRDKDEDLKERRPNNTKDSKSSSSYDKQDEDLLLEHVDHDDKFESER